MANWKFRNGLHLVNRPQLGIVPLSPSPDPVSLAFDAAMLALSVLGPLLGKSGSEEANELVNKYQNPLQNALGKISDAFTAAGPNVPAEQLYTWANQVQQLGDKFEEITHHYPNKGEGARRTIFGIRSGDIWVQQPPQAPGYLTGLLNNILQHAEEAALRQQQMGFDWSSLIKGGLDFGTRVFDDMTDGDYYPPTYTPPYVPPGTRTTPPMYYAPPAESNTALWVIGGLALLLLGPRLMKGLF